MADVQVVRLKTLTKRQKDTILLGQLNEDYNTFRPQYMDLSDYILPTRARFILSQANKGDRRNHKILNSAGTTAARSLRSGMMSGVTSPARRWFKLASPDPELNKYEPVKEWLHDVAEILNTSFLKSNLYQTLPLVYGDLGTFGTAPFSVEEDFQNVLHTQSFPIGSYRIGKDWRGRVNVFFREFRMTVQQLVEQFGNPDQITGMADWSNFSEYVKNLYAQGEYQTWVDICHVVQPNDEYDPRKLHSKYKKFSSRYYEKGTGQNGTPGYQADIDDRYLSEKGYDFFPILCPRWEVAGEDVYATNCPGMTAIGDVKQLQWGEKRIAQAIDTMIKPPMKGPAGMRNARPSIVPGDMTYFDEREGSKGFSPVYQIEPRIQEMEMKQRQIEERIDIAFYKNLFEMMMNSDRRDITAREIDERSEEKLSALGPVMGQIDQDGLDPLIDLAFDLHLRQRLLPEAPREIQGMNLRVEYISIMAQAQKMIGVSVLERYAQFAGQLAVPYPESVKKTNTHKLLDAYGDMLSLHPGIIRAEEEVAQIEQQEQQVVQQQQQQEAMAQNAQTAQRLSGADLGGDNALSRMINGAKPAGM